MGARHRKPAMIGAGAMLAVAAVAGGIFAFSGTDSNAAEDCGGLDTALQNNLNFIAGQKANPDAQSEARIANRQAVVDLIQQRREAAGCEGDGGANNANQGNANQGNANQGNANQGNNNAGNQGQATAQPAPEQPDASQGGASGQQVCNGSTVTLSGEGGAPAASSGEFPIGTTLKVTNLDNNKSTTVKVASVSGSCVLLNNAAFEQVREPGKFLIRRAKIEKIG